MIFSFETTVLPDWIDYNSHMRDSYFGLIFSLAVDALQNELGIDEAYRKGTGCTIYLLEDHKVYLAEVKEGARVRVETRILGCDAKRFHLYMQMLNNGALAAVGEFMELHVVQSPTPRSLPFPKTILERLQAAVIPVERAEALPHRSRVIGLSR